MARICAGRPVLSDSAREFSHVPKRFHAVMAEDSGQSVLSSLESHVLPLIPGLADRIATGIRVLDVGCGSGRIMNRLADQ
ncbi:MAG: hypothetical protein A2X88_08440 [Deltaproteobacteria bacterium GWC2_65_14]|nr:MAG: hypothetical protein A2X88_08440 [Deltaproteobacteria bacterium GWC2_65_14]